MELLILDLETTVKNKIGDHKANPFCPDNYVVLGGYMEPGGAVWPRWNTPPEERYTLVGHNLKFDTQYLRKENEAWWDYIVENGIWDTMVAEYLLTAQQSMYASLDECSARYGGTLKDDKFKKMWDEGVQTEDMDRDELYDYWVQDLKNTELVAKAQIAEAERLGMLPLCKAMMAATLTTTEMEWNGLHIDRGRLEAIEASLEAERQDILSKMLSEVANDYPDLPAEAINLNSNKQLSALLFGGEIVYKDKELIGEYKTGPKKGEPKYRNLERHVNVQPRVPVKEEWLNKNGYYNTNDEVLGLLKNDSQFIQDIIRLRYLTKQVSTYCSGLKGLVFEDGFIHHNLNTTATVTGRLSSSNPNMQNQPNDSPVKEYFDSRYGVDGYIVQADYSQLEVIWQAFLTQDRNMMNDIKNGVDFHCKRLALKLGESYESVFHKCKVLDDDEYNAMRKDIKTFSFQRSYGAGAVKIAASTGMSVDEVKGIIKAEEKEYPGLVRYFNKVRTEVDHSLVNQPVAGKTEKGADYRKGFYKSITGRVYAFKENDSPDFMVKKGILTSVSPTIIKNYPVQGGATGDLIPTMMAMLFYKLKKYNEYGEKFVLINQVHDSIMLDVHKDYLNDICLATKRTLEDAPRIMNKLFKLNFGLPLTVDIEYGINWKEATKWKGFYNTNEEEEKYASYR